MIAKHIPMRSAGKSSFAGLAQYITDAQDKSERIGGVQITNCAAATMPAAVAEILATQRLNTRAKGDKTYHLLVSLRAGENPSREILKAVEDRICVALGYAEHQRVSAVHLDTDNVHIHIAINKIHPKRRTLHEPFRAYQTLADTCSALEREYGLAVDNHQPKKRVEEGRAVDMEHHAGIESLIGWIKRECLKDMQNAQSWAELHGIMRENGLELRQRGNGLVIVSVDGGIATKASSVDRDLSKPKLEARLGLFRVPEIGKRQENTVSKRAYLKEPIRLRVDTSKLYARYQAEKAHLTTNRTIAIAQARERKNAALKQAKRLNTIRRGAIKMLDVDNKKVLYAQAYTSYKARLAKIHREYAEERERACRGNKRCTWADWLRNEAVNGNQDALAALRVRATAGLRGNTFGARGKTAKLDIPQDGITKKGTVIYRTAQVAIRDDGDRLQVSRGATQAGLQIALRIAVDHYGTHITVNGSSQFKASIVRAAVVARLSITFADAVLENRRQVLLKEINNDTRGRAGRGLGRARAGRIGSINRGTATGGAGGGIRKPDVGRIGRCPPPECQNCLRDMSALGVVQDQPRGEMLLPGDVSPDLEQGQSRHDGNVRRKIHELTTEQVKAMDKYIAERNAKRTKITDIPEHMRYTDGNATLLFAGLRHVDGQALVLFREESRNSRVMVLPVDQKTAQRLTRISIGTPVHVTERGSVRLKGRSK
jgi:hypothetical protein